MGSNREIKSDGNVIIKGLTWPSSDGSADQVLKTDGNGALSFATVASGGGSADTIASASEAASYTGTANVIYITSTEDVIFTSSLYDRIIFVYGCNVKFQDCNLSDSFISLPNRNLTLENTSTNGTTDTLLDSVTVRSRGDLILDASGNTSGNTVRVRYCKINCENFTPTDRSNTAYTFTDNEVFVQDLFDGGDATNNLAIFNSSVNTKQISGEVNLSTTGSIINVRHESLAGTKIKIGGTTYIDGAYAFPFRVNKNGVQTSVNVIASTDAGQTITTGTLTDVVFEDEEIDNTSSYDSSNGVFTAPVKGLYAIDARITFGSSANLDAGQLVYVKIYKNSSVQLTGHISESVDSTSLSVMYGSGVSGVVNLDSGDTLKAMVFQSSGVSDDLHNQGDACYIHIHKIN